jgi:hypothetical protein
MDRQPSKFIERLSTMLVVLASVGTIIVLIDPVILLSLPSGTTIKFGGTGFSDQLKGAVVSLILVSGFAGVIAYWLGASNAGDKAQDSVNVIAQAAAPAQAAAVAAATGQPQASGTINADTVDVDAKNVTVNTAAPTNEEK